MPLNIDYLLTFVKDPRNVSQPDEEEVIRQPVPVRLLTFAAVENVWSHRR